MGTAEREMAAVVAHGLINTLAVITGSASTLCLYGERLTETDVSDLFAGLTSNIQLFEDVLSTIVEECSAAFADAATTLVLAARSFEALTPGDRDVVLDAIVDKSKVLHTGLSALVRGLSPEVVAVLDSLRPSPT